MIYASAQQVPPFAVVMSSSDYLKIYGIMGVVLAIGFAVLGVLVSKMCIRDREEPIFWPRRLGISSPAPVF